MDSFGTAVGKSFKDYQWMVFQVATGTVLGPRAEHTGRRFDPPPGKHDLRRCIALADWWREVNANTVSFGGTTSAFAPPVAREHKLFKDAATEIYFDCTVEVRRLSFHRRLPTERIGSNSPPYHLRSYIRRA